MTGNQEIEYIRFGEKEYDKEGKPIRERFGIGEVVRRNSKTITVRLVEPFQSWRKKYPIGAGFRIPYRYCVDVKAQVCERCGSTIWVADEEIECECDEDDLDGWKPSYNGLLRRDS